MPVYDKTKTTQTSNKPTRKVVAASWANAIMLLILMLTGLEFEPALQDNIKEILAAAIVSGVGGLATLATGWFKNPAKGDSVNK